MSVTLPLTVSPAASTSYWPGAPSSAAGLQLLIMEDSSFGLRRPAPAFELTLLVPLSAVTACNHGRVRLATTGAHWAEVRRHHRLIRGMALFITALVTAALVTAANTAAPAALVHALRTGEAAGGSFLLVAALNIWGTNVVISALWFWTTDHGGAALHIQSSIGKWISPQTSWNKIDDE